MHPRPVVLSMICGLILAAAGCAGTQDAPNEQLANGADTPLEARVPLQCLVGAGTPELMAKEAPQRVSGTANIPLARSTIDRLASAGVRKLAVITVYCVDPQGQVSCIDFGGNDRPRDVAQTLIDALQAWRFGPFVRDGQPSGFCRTVTHHYKLQ